MIIRGSETVIIVRKNETEERDEYGQPITSTENIIIKNCLIAVSSTSETEDENRNPEDIKLRIFLPSEIEIQETDTFIIRNTHFVKDGTPFTWESPFYNIKGGVELYVRKRNG